MARRGKTQMKLIKNEARRQVTLSKRRNGLLKKAYELSVLCDVEVGVILFSRSGRLDEFASGPSLQKTIDRYKGYTNKGTAVHQDIQQVKADTIILAKELEALECSKQKILGKKLQGCSAEELKILEVELEKSLYKIREKKTELLDQKMVKLKEKEGVLLKDNEELRQKQRSFDEPLPLSSMAALQLPDVPESSNCDVDVGTELYIGLPNIGRKGNSNRGSGGQQNHGRFSSLE